MFKIFDQDLEEFRRATVYLDNFLSKLRTFNNMQRSKTGTSAHDIVIAGLSFKRSFEEAYRYWHTPRDIAFNKDPVKQELTPDPLKYLEAAVKGLLFPIRSFQDNIYGIFLYLDDQPTGPGTTIKTCLESPDSPTRKLINQKLSKYSEWFFGMREIRNRIKSGNSFSFGFKAERFGVILNDLDGANSALKSSLDHIISIDTFVCAFKQSAAIANLALSYAKNKNMRET